MGTIDIASSRRGSMPPVTVPAWRAGRWPRVAALLVGLAGLAGVPAVAHIVAEKIEAAVREHIERHRLTFASPLAFTPSSHAPLGMAQPSDCRAPANPVVEENCKPGSDDWFVPEPSYTIVGYVFPTSVALGDTVEFRVSTSAPAFDIDIYRSGYYAGKGGRLVMSIASVRGGVQPPCLDDPTLGLRSCANWQTSWTLTVPGDWVSGVYLAVLTRRDDGRKSVIPFVVRDDERGADILYQYDLSTYQAYNNYGGKSLYSFNSGHCETVADAPRAVKVSLARPHVVPPTDPTSYFRVEYPMVYWLEAQGYDVSYSTSLDTHWSGLPGHANELLEHKVFLAVGHDEYWSAEMRGAMTQARDAGIHLAFFTGNTGYWKIRFEADPWTGEADLAMVCYKTAESGPADPTGDPTSLWRDPNGPNRPENELVGIMFTGANATVFFPLRVSAEMTHDRVFRNTGLDQLPSGSYVDIGRQLIGWEWDTVGNNGWDPEGLTVVTMTPTYGELGSDMAERYFIGPGFSSAAYYTAPSGAMVFAAGTIQWSWGLAIIEPDSRIQQITYNVLADMDVRPATPSEALVLDDEPRMRVVEREPLEFRFPQDPLPPVIEALSVEAEPHSAVVTWRTDRPAKGEAWLVSSQGETLTYLLGIDPLAAVTGPDGLTHHVTFKNLQPDTVYHLVVAAATEDRNFSVSEVNKFLTPSAGPVNHLRRSVAAGARDMACAVKPIARPFYYWVRAHWVLTAAIGCALVAAYGVLRWRVRRRPSDESW